MYQAFISYRRKNGYAVAKMLREMLKARGVSAFMDLDELRSGTFDDKILLAIESSPSFLLILPPGALDRCAREGDWLAREIIAAVDSGRKIVPVLCDGFVWPTLWPETTPEKIRNLAKLNSVIMSEVYIDATVDKVIEYMREDEASQRPLTDGGSVSEIDSFFRNYMQDMEAIAGVDLAFHAGSVWHENIDRLDILSALADAGKQIRVVVNTPEAAELISQHMRHKLKRYIPFEEAASLWQNFASMYENVEVRVCDIPMLRIQYTFRMRQPERDVMRIKYYTYGNARIDNNFSQNFGPEDPHFSLYRTEFEYLWAHSEPIK